MIYRKVVNFMKSDISKYVGQQIRNHRRANKMTQKELGIKIGVKHNTISSYENGTNEAEQNTLFSIANTLNISINDLFPPVEYLDETGNDFVKERKEIDYTYIPTTVSAGQPVNVDGITQCDKISISNTVMGKWSNEKDIFIMRVNGESMNRIIPNASLIAVKPIELNKLRDGDIVVYSDDYDYAVKRYYRDGDRIIFRPDSNDQSFYDYITSTSNSNLKIHGKVVLYIVELD